MNWQSLSNRGRTRKVFLLGIVAVIVIVLKTYTASAHCDGLDGPVVAAAQTALQTGNINHVLIWVRPEDAAEIERAFDEARTVRKLSPVAEKLADRSFFETVVRVHRVSEGAPYTGLKTADVISDRLYPQPIRQSQQVRQKS